MNDATASQLDADALLRAACAAAKLDDFGDTGFVEPLREYVAAAARYFPFTETRAAGFADGIVNQLVNRLRMIDDLKRYPEILLEDVSDPIVITGMPRTGTTKLQRVLSADPANRMRLKVSRGPSVRSAIFTKRFEASMGTPDMLPEVSSTRMISLGAASSTLTSALGWTRSVKKPSTPSRWARSPTEGVFEGRDRATGQALPTAGGVPPTECVVGTSGVRRPSEPTCTACSAPGGGQPPHSRSRSS